MIQISYFTGKLLTLAKEEFQQLKAVSQDESINKEPGIWSAWLKNNLQGLPICIGHIALDEGVLSLWQQAAGFKNAHLLSAFTILAGQHDRPERLPTFDNQQGRDLMQTVLQEGEASTRSERWKAFVTHACAHSTPGGYTHAQRALDTFVSDFEERIVLAQHLQQAWSDVRTRQNEKQDLEQSLFDEKICAVVSGARHEEPHPVLSQALPRNMGPGLLGRKQPVSAERTHTPRLSS